MLLLNPLSLSILDIYNLMSLITKAFYIKDYEDFDFLYGHDDKILDCNALQLALFGYHLPLTSGMHKITMTG